jgi:hypothetical protein
MIQRAQSIYLLAVTILMVFLIVLPVAEVAISGGEILIYYNYGIKRYVAENSEIIVYTIPVTIITCVIGLASFFNIFLYTNRNMQMRICLYNILLLIGLIVLIYFYFIVIRKRLDVIGHSFRMAIMFPIISIILTLMALRGIRSDEALVKSTERLR